MVDSDIPAPETQAPKEEYTQEQQNEMYANKAEELFKPLNAKCEEFKAALAFAIVIDPEFPDKPLVYAKGNIYPLAKLIAHAARYYKTKIMEELES